MSDLISRKALMKEIELSMRDNPHKDSKISLNHFTEHQHFMSIVSKQPTAYDVDKVVEQLDGIRKDDNIRFADQVVNRAIRIVKGRLEE